MPSPKDGSPGSLVAPTAPTEALDADDAEPGKVESVKATERELKKGKYGSTPVTPFKKPEDTPADAAGGGSDPAGDALSGSGSSSDDPPPAKKLTWIEIVLVDANDKEVPGEAYRITMADGSVKEGALDDKGFARVDGVDPGMCKVTFPMMDGRSWKKV